MILRLPLPPSPNRIPSNPFAAQRFKDGYRRRAWLAAIEQAKPLRDPPALVTVHAMFLMCRRFRDEDNLKAALKFPLDALRQNQHGKMRWRNGLYTACGFLIDDDPTHMKLGDVWQERCASKDWEELILEITEAQ